MEVHQFKFTGYQNYCEVEKDIEKLFRRAFERDNPSFTIAVNEAMCNAARYSIYGITTAPIEITVRLSGYDIAVTVKSITEVFDTQKYQAELQELAKDPAICNMEWGDYLADNDASRGIWYMLTAVDYLYFDTLGQSVTLATRTDGKSDMFNEPNTKIGALVPKFLVNEGGVIV